MMAFEADARTCGRCNGKGMCQVNIGSGGLYSPKKQCQYCGQVYDTGSSHWCRCTNCGGTGEVGSSRTASTSMLYPSEAQQVQQIMQLINFGEAVWVDCQICHGDGKCPQCRGAGGASYYDWETGRTYGGCIACGNSGICPSCKGGCKEGKQYRPISNEYRERLFGMLRSIMQTAMNRQR